MLKFLKVKQQKNKSVLIIKILIWLTVFLLFIFIGNKNFSLNGVFNVTYDSKNKSNIITNFAAKEPYELMGHLNPNRDYFQYITTTPVYFDVNLPRLFSKATVTVKYKNPNDQPVIRLGVKQKNDAYVYRDMAITSNQLTKLPDHWNRIQEGNVILWQKNQEYYDAKKEKLDDLEKWYEIQMEEVNEIFSSEYLTPQEQNESSKMIDDVDDEYELKLIKINNEVIQYKSDKVNYNTIGEFINSFPNTEEVLKYNYDLSSKVELSGYETSNQKTIINRSIRGSHNIYTYIGPGEDLDFIFTIQDANRHEGEDIMSIKVFNSKGEIVEEVDSSDDGEDMVTGQINPERRHQLLLKNLPFGTYRLSVIIPYDDIFIKKIETQQHLLMFRGNIYLTDSNEYQGFIDTDNIYPSTIYTDSSFISARTSHENSFQVLRIGNENLKIEEKHLMHRIDLDEDITPIVSPKNDIYIEGNGYFVFNKDQFFDANYNSIKNIDSVENIDDYNYIIAELPEVKKDGEWLVADAEIEVPYLYITEGKDKIAKFIIDLPGLPENNRELLIHELSIKFEKNPFTLKAAVDRIKNIFN
ncbi:MAG: hypothetical protein Q8P20_02760 [bacterium]|nr:hypothetical protein [bacterium]